MKRAVAEETSASPTGKDPPASLNDIHGTVPEQPGSQLGAGAVLRKPA